MKAIAQSVQAETSPVTMLDPLRCQFAFADGRQCRMPALCAAHARAQVAKETGNPAEPAEPIDLAPLSGEFTTATEINRALGKVFLLLAQNRIPRRNAVALGYIAQLMLQTLPRVREEIIEVCGDEDWQKTLESAVCDEEDTKDETNDDQAGSAAQSEPADENDRAEFAEDHSEEMPAPESEPAFLGAPISRLAGSEMSTSTREPAGVDAALNQTEIALVDPIVTFPAETKYPEPGTASEQEAPQSRLAPEPAKVVVPVPATGKYESFWDRPDAVEKFRSMFPHVTFRDVSAVE